jgi:peptidoglycan/xylan/chitin deacetylase (PgdA/CDA1 family)
MKAIISLAGSVIISFLCISAFTAPPAEIVGQTEITKWQFGKKAAVSITYDDGSSNQFKYALPVMERLNLPATFFVITGPIIGSYHPGKFIGRSVKDIIAESRTFSTNATNFFERASAAKFLGYKGTFAFYDKAASLYDQEKMIQAYAVMDSLYQKVRSGTMEPGQDVSMEFADEKGLSWAQIKEMAAKGYEFASHTVTHAHLAILDSANMLYELQKSKDDVLKNLGVKYTFSAEVPFGIEDKRVMRIAVPVYDALRNWMPDEYMQEINRGYKDQPGISTKEYVQWQRGPLSKTPYGLMKSWVDTSVAHDNIWLVLVFHGVEGLGWEPISTKVLDDYFQYIKRHDEIWVATFGDAARYMRERMAAKVKSDFSKNEIVVNLNHSLDKQQYDLPLTLKTYVPSPWKKVVVNQSNKQQRVQPQHDKAGMYILYQASPNAGAVTLSAG